MGGEGGVMMDDGETRGKKKEADGHWNAELMMVLMRKTMAVMVLTALMTGD